MEQESNAGVQRRDTEDSDEMIYVKMDTFGVTSAKHKFPMLRTTEVGFCVAVVLWDPKSKIAGLVHISSAMDKGLEEPQQDILNMLNTMQRDGVSNDTTHRINAHILGGYYQDNLGEIVVEKLKKLGIVNILSNERAIVSAFNLAIDARTGEVFNLVNLKPLASEMKHGTIRPKGGAVLTSDSRTLS